MLIKIHVEEVNEDAIRAELDLQLWCASYTLYHAKGVWQGVSENTLVIEIEVTPHLPRRAVINRAQRLCRRLRDIACQRCVMFYVLESEGFLV